MDKINTESDKNQAITDMIQEVCQFFGFGCGFIYVADRTGSFTLYKSYKAYTAHQHLQGSICLREKLGDDLYQKLIDDKYTAFDNTTAHDQLMLILAEEFRASAMVLLPILDKDRDIQAFIGMADRRGESRKGEQDVRFAHTMLAVIANYVKILLSQQQSEGSMHNLSSILDHTGVSVYVADFETDEIIYVNEIVAKEYGSANSLIGRKCKDSLFDDQAGPCVLCPKERLVDEHQKPTKVYIWNHHKVSNDTWLRVTSSAFHWVDGRLAYVVSSVDITEGKRNEAKIRRYAEYDTLTGLMNRHKLLLDCDDGIERVKAENREGYLIFCDLNDFKAVNDTYGHQVGDELLKQLGVFFRNDPHTKDHTYRYGGDEFVILCFDHTHAEAEALKTHILETFSKPWQLSCGSIFCNTSAGITVYPHDAKTTSDLLHAADQAMYQTKPEQRRR